MDVTIAIKPGVRIGNAPTTSEKDHACTQKHSFLNVVEFAETLFLTPGMPGIFLDGINCEIISFPIRQRYNIINDNAVNFHTRPYISVCKKVTYLN